MEKEERQYRVLGHRSTAVQLCEVDALAAAPSVKSTSKMCPLEKMSRDRTRSGVL